MNDIFEFIKKPYFLRKNLQFRPEDPYDKISHRNRTIWHRIFFFQMNVKLSSSSWTLRQKQNLTFQETALEVFPYNDS